jgi:hypothetical protein
MTAEQARTPGGRPGDETSPEILSLLQSALAPVEPPASLVDELEARLAGLSAAALETLEDMADWEMAAIRDPRNWVRPAAALAVGTAAGGALVLLQLRRSRRQRAAGLRGLAEHGSKAVAGAATAARERLREAGR